MVGFNCLKIKKKMQLGQDLIQDQFRAHTLAQRELFSQVSGLYEPTVLVTPAKHKRDILVRRAFQEAKSGSCQVKCTWDMPLSDCLREDAALQGVCPAW